jgi:hypothetical protein
VVPTLLAALVAITGGPLALVAAEAAIADDEAATGSGAERQDLGCGEQDPPPVSRAADGEHGSGSIVAGGPVPVPLDGPGSWAGFPSQLGQAFVLGSDEPSGDVGVQNHAVMVRAAAVRRQ